jgi:uncharacterized UPF0160 family protein
MSIGIVPRSFGSHSGGFHADEVTACALLLYFQVIDQDKIIRTRDERRLDCCDFVCDVGGEYDPKRRRFDHHQVEYKGGLSSAGMILAYLKEEKIISHQVFDYLNRSLITGIDQVDNGVVAPIYGHCNFSQVIANFGCIVYDATEREEEEAFNEALDFVLGHLDRLIRRYEYMEKCGKVVIDLMKQMNECLVFDRAMPWMEVFFENGGEAHGAEFVIMPSGGQWKLRGIPPSYDRRMEVRKALPKDWAGLLGEDLVKKTGISGAVFCHKGRFISIWKTKEDAIRALKYTLEQ